MTARRPAGRSANVARGPWWKPIGPDRSADGPLMGSPESRRAAPERSTWAAAHPSTGQEEGVSRLVGSGARTPNRVTTGREPVRRRLGGGCRGGERHRPGPDGARGPAGDGRAPAPGHRGPARAGHAVRIEADRTVPTYLRRHAAPARTPIRRRVKRTREVDTLPTGPVRRVTPSSGHWAATDAHPSTGAVESGLGLHQSGADGGAG